MLIRSVRNFSHLLIALTVIYSMTNLSSVFSNPSKRAAITGKVTDADTHEPLPAVSINMLDKFGGTTTDTNGVFALRNLQPGTYVLQISHVGYETRLTDSLRLTEGQTVDLQIAIEQKPVSIKGVRVTPGQYSIMGNEPATRQILPKEVIETRPQLSEDLFRAVQRLPGITYNDFSAKFTIRGGEQDEVLINLDGMELYEPFHLKDVDGGVISITDVAAVEGVDLLAGGYPAYYGDRMSGVFNIKSREPGADTRRASVGLSLMNARFLGEGTFANQRGAWLVSGRRGYIDLVLGALGQDDQVRPKYYDVFGKLRYRLNHSQMLTANFLKADDDLRYLGSVSDGEDNTGDTLLSSYGNTYFWLTLDSYLSSKVVARTIASVGEVSSSRNGQVFNEFGWVPEMRVNDRRSFTLFGIKSDWDFEASDRLLFKIGLDVKHVSAEYDYAGHLYNYAYFPGQEPAYQLQSVDSRLVSINPSGQEVSTYLSNRIRFASFLTGELGVRYDYTSYSGDRDWSPRANLAISFSKNTSLRLGWGYFYQVERIDEISVQDGETEFHSSERAEHFVAGLEHTATNGENILLNLFYKKYTGLQPAYRNTFGELVTFPELEEDRVEVRFNGKTAWGIELCLKRDIGQKASWWASYSMSKVRDDIKSLYFYHEDVLVNYNREFPYPYDQLHTFYLDFNYRFSPKWQLSLAWQVHTGWPYTEVEIKDAWQGNDPILFLQATDPWQGRLDVFKRLDVRMNRKFETSRGTITAFVEVINVLADVNVRNYEYSLVSRDGVYSIQRSKETWFGPMPSFGISYDFRF